MAERSKENTSKNIRKAPKKKAIRVCCTYQMISTEAALAIAGIMPITLMIREMTLVGI